MSNHVCNGAVVKRLLARADKLGSTPGDAVFFFFCTVFFRLVFVFNTIIPFGLLFFILTADPVDPVLGSIYILSLSPEYILKKGFQELLICILAKLTAKKKHKLSRHVPPLK